MLEGSKHGRTWTRVRPTRGQSRALLAGIIGLLITAFAVYLAYRAELSRSREQFEEKASDIRVALQANLAMPLEFLRVVPPFFAASQSVERHEFDAFAASALSRQRGIAYFAYAPEITDAERATFTALAREQGFADFEVREQHALGIRPAPTRPRYMPLLHVAPRDEALLGMDLLADPEQREAAKQTLSSGELRAAPGLGQMRRAPGDQTLLVMAPLLRPEPLGPDPRAPRTGLAVVALRIAPLVHNSVARRGLRELDLVLLDESAPPWDRVLFESVPGAFAASREQTSGSSQSISYCGRRLTLRFLPRPGTITAGVWPFLVFAFGSLLSLVTTLALGAIEVVRRLRNEVRSAHQLGQYRLIRKLGEGGMGVVYQAEHALLRRPTAVKVITPNVDERELTERFEREVKATSQLTHPNTVAVYDFGRTPEGVFYYAMEYLPGCTLETLVRTTGPLPPARVVHLLLQICGSLGEAHRHGLVHRDIKPSNIIVCERGGIADFVKVLDFGLVKDVAANAVTRRTEPGHLLGTPQYMAPEVLREPGNVSPALDLYAVGAVAYFCLAGHEVFEHAPLPTLIAHHLFDTPEPPSASLATALPRDLEALVLRCLSKSPTERPASAEELAQLLESCNIPRWTQADAQRAWSETQRNSESPLSGDSSDTGLCSTLAVDMGARAS